LCHPDPGWVSLNLPFSRWLIIPCQQMQIVWQEEAILKVKSAESH
jgi:hypothetical protein